MAVIRCDFDSEVLEVSTSMTVLVPQDERTGVPTAQPPQELAVLYLLHGLSDDSTAWLRHTNLERYLWERPLVVVMPQVGRSFYADEVHGHRYWTFLTEELPTLVSSFFRVSVRREDTYVAGLSMGGYGALKWALRQPERFAGAASLSGALDLRTLMGLPERQELAHRVYDGRIGPDDDLFALLDQADVEALPPLFVGCGTEDPLYEGNSRFAAAATAAGLDLRVDFRPGEHEWGFWDASLPDLLAWLPRDPDPTASSGTLVIGSDPS